MTPDQHRSEIRPITINRASTVVFAKISTRSLSSHYRWASTKSMPCFAWFALLFSGSNSNCMMFNMLDCYIANIKKNSRKRVSLTAIPMRIPCSTNRLATSNFLIVNSNFNPPLLALHTTKSIQSRPRHLRHNRHQSMKKLTVSTSANMVSEIAKSRYQRL